MAQLTMVGGYQQMLLNNPNTHVFTYVILICLLYEYITKYGCYIPVYDTGQIQQRLYSLADTLGD